jgi:mannosyltransferase OCH1-like enzyme
VNGILLVVRMHSDDLPLRLFATREEIGKYLDTPGALQNDIDEAIEKTSWIGSHASALVGVEFQDGKPVDSFHVMLID